MKSGGNALDDYANSIQEMMNNAQAQAQAAQEGGKKKRRHRRKVSGGSLTDYMAGMNAVTAGVGIQS
jgi:hypothetical protein